jgi:Protein of unknown function (DUF3592)
MKGLVARLIAYVFVGSFCIVGPLFLIVALGSALQRTALIYSGLRAEGTVIAKRSMGSTRVTYAPVFQFTANDGRTYIVSSDVYGRESAFRYGERVHVLYRQSHPESARINAFAPLWTFPLVFGVVGAGFSVIPALMLANWMRRRRTFGGEPDVGPAHVAIDTARPRLRWALGLVLTGGGLVLLAVGLGVVSSDSSSVNESRVLVTSLGVLLAACGVLLGQWVAVGSRLYHALGGTAVTSMAIIFGWVAIYGEASGFSGGVSIGGAALTSNGSATPARIAFGIVSVVFGLASLPAWKQVFRQRG